MNRCTSLLLIFLLLLGHPIPHSHAEYAIGGSDSHDSKPHFHIGNGHHHSSDHQHDDNEDHHGHHGIEGTRSDTDGDAHSLHTTGSDQPADVEVRHSEHDSDAVYVNFELIGPDQRNVNGMTITMVQSIYAWTWEYPIVVRHVRWQIDLCRLRASIPVYLLHSSLLI